MKAGMLASEVRELALLIIAAFFAVHAVVTDGF